jgi:hypothetical protein
LHAAVLALLLTPGRAREMAVWRDENRHTVGAKELAQRVDELPPPSACRGSRTSSASVAHGPLDKRQQLLRAVRRLIAADGRAHGARPLRWLAIRHALGDVRALALPAAPRSSSRASQPRPRCRSRASARSCRASCRRPRSTST